MAQDAVSAQEMGAGGDGSEVSPEKDVKSQPIVAEDGAVWYGVDEKKVFDKFHHYDKDGNGKLDAQEVVDLSVDLYHAFHPGQALTPEQIKDVHDNLLQRMDERHGDQDGTVCFEEFLPWYAQAAEKHWKMAHGLPHETHDSSGGVATPLDMPLRSRTEQDAPLQSKKENEEAKPVSKAITVGEEEDSAVLEGGVRGQVLPARLDIAQGLEGSVRSLEDSVGPFTARSTESNVTVGTRDAATRRHRQRRRHTPGARSSGESGSQLEATLTPSKPEAERDREGEGGVAMKDSPEKRAPAWLLDSHVHDSSPSHVHARPAALLSPIQHDSRARILEVSFGLNASHASAAEEEARQRAASARAPPVPWFLKPLCAILLAAMLLVFVGGLVAGTSRDPTADPLHPPAPLGRSGCSFYFCAGDVSYGFFTAGTVSSGVFSAASSVSVGVFSTGFVSVGLVSVGFCSVGVVSFGVFSLGLLSVGHIVLGLWAWGTYAFFKRAGYSAHAAPPPPHADPHAPAHDARYRYLDGNPVGYTAVITDSATGGRGARPAAMDVENSLATRSRAAEVRDDLEAAGRAMDRSQG